MLKPRTIALSVFAIWGFIAVIYYIRNNRDPTTVTTVTAADHKSEQKQMKTSTSLTKESTQKIPKDDDTVDEKPEFKGEILLKGNLCLDTLEHKSGNVGLWECHGQGRNQYWHITKSHQLRNDDICIQASAENENNNFARLERCDEKNKEQKWVHKDGLLVLIGTERCIDGEDRNGLKVIKCDKNSSNQKVTLSSAKKELGA